MKQHLQSFICFFKKETVLCIAGILALISAFFVPPSVAYLQYIDFRVLSLLFCLMLVVALAFKALDFLAAWVLPFYQRCIPQDS